LYGASIRLQRRGNGPAEAFSGIVERLRVRRIERNQAWVGKLSHDERFARFRRNARCAYKQCNGNNCLPYVPLGPHGTEDRP
jgi:hypothetical protein